MTSRIEVDAITDEGQVAQTPASASPDVGDPLRSMRVVKWLTRLFVYPGVTALIPLDHAISGLTWQQAISVHVGGFIIATIAIEIAFGQAFKLRKHAAYPNMLVMELGEAQTVDAAAQHALPVLNRLLGVRASFIALAGDEAEHSVASAFGMSRTDAQRYLQAGASSIREATHIQQPVLWEPDGTKSAEVRLNGDERLFFIPVVALQQPIGVLAVVGRKGNRDLKDGELMSNIGSALGLSLENLRQKQDLSESEKRFRTVVTNTQVVLFAIDREGTFTLSEGKGLDALGLKAGEAVGLSVFDVYRDQPQILENIRRGLAGESFAAIVDVGGLAFETQYAPVRDHNGEVVGLTGVATDITERMRAEEALRESETRFRTLVESTFEGIAISEGGKVLEANESFATMFGYESAEVIGLSPLEMTTPASAELIMKHIRSGFAKPYEITGVKKDGTTFDIEVVGKDCLYQGRNARVTAFHDITERKRAEETLRESEEKFRTLAETSAAATFIFQGTRLRYVNSATEALTGYDREELLTMNFWDVMHPDSRELVKQRGLARQRGEPVSRRYEAKLLTKNGEERWADFAVGVIEFEGKPAVLGTAFDVTERKQAEDALRESEEKYRDLVENMSEILYALDKDGRITYVSPVVEQLGGYTPSELIGRLFTEFIHPDDLMPLVESFQRTVSGNLEPSEFRIFTKSGEIRWVRTSSQPVFEGDRVIGLRAVMMDITERKRAEETLREREETLRATIESTEDGILVVGSNGQIAYANARLAKMWRIPKDVLETSDRDKVLTSVMDQLQEPEAFLARARELNHTPDESFDELVFKDGRIFERLSRPLTSEEAPGRVFSFRDITERKRAEDTIKHMAYHDSLTDLPNRALFEDRLTVALAQVRRKRRMAAVMFLDLDRFKVVNDTVGHALGDRLLQSVAERLTGLVRDGDTVARVGGDEFTLLLQEVGRAEEVAEVAERVLDALRQPWVLNGHEFRITTSIGIAMFPNDGEDVDSLLSNADTAMYRAKDQGRDNYKLYTPAMNARIVERLALENSLRHGLERGEFLVYYQPQVDIASGKIVGMEALVRWQHPERGLVFPAEFIPVAEETGLIVPLGAWVLRTACAQNKAWQAAGFPPMRVAVNLSARQFQQRDLIEVVDEVLKETGLEARWLQLEITEGMAMQDVESNIAVLRELREMGVQIAIDDFGTGHSSLSYLSRLPIDVIKIDQSFVQDLTTDPNGAAIARSIIVMAHNLKLRVIAEGVETEEQLAFLKKRRCDEMQGYLFSKPAPAEAFEEMLRQGGRTSRARGPVEASR